MFWPSPFKFDEAGQELREPRMLYISNGNGGDSNYAAERYELGRMEDPEASPARRA